MIVAGSTWGVLLSMRQGRGGWLLRLVVPCQRDDPGTVSGHEGDDFFHGFGDDVFGAVDHEHHGVGVFLDPLDEVGIDRKARGVEPGDNDH